MIPICLDCGCSEYANSHGDPRHIVLAELEAAAKASGVTTEVAARRIYQAAVKIAHQRIMRAMGVRCGCPDCAPLTPVERLAR